MMSRSRPPGGVVLATVLLLMVAVTLLAHGTMVLARSFRQGAVETWEATRVRRAVTGRVAEAARAGDTVSTGWVAAGPGVEVALRAIRLSTESVLLAGTGRAPTARWWVGQLVWGPDPATRAAVLPAVGQIGGTVLSGSEARVLSPAGAGCPPGGVPLPPLGGLPPERFGVGPLDADQLAALLVPWSSGAGGSGVATGSVRLLGGIRSGVFLVRGDLVMAEGAVLRGMLFVEGSVLVMDSARIEGAVQTIGDLVVSPGASIRGDPCAVADAWAGLIAGGLRPFPMEPPPWPLWGPPTGPGG